MCEVVLNTGNITLESGIAGTVNPFNFIFDVRSAGQGSSGWSGSVWRRG